MFHPHSSRSWSDANRLPLLCRLNAHVIRRRWQFVWAAEHLQYCSGLALVGLYRSYPPLSLFHLNTSVRSIFFRNSSAARKMRLRRRGGFVFICCGVSAIYLKKKKRQQTTRSSSSFSLAHAPHLLSVSPPNFPHLPNPVFSKMDVSM